MENRNCEQLFEYLRSILYDTKVQPLDLEKLDEPYQKLGMGLQYLDKMIQEMKAYSAALSKGDLSGTIATRGNSLCDNLKNIQANLNHLTWQAKQVAKGDYSQTVSYLGEFSDAFNTMTAQLRERENALRLEAEMEKHHADMTESYNALLLDLISGSEEEIIVTNVDGTKILYCNREGASEDLKNEEIYKMCLQEAAKERSSDSEALTSVKWYWEAEDSEHRFYKIRSRTIAWEDEKAYTHIIREVTETKQREEMLRRKAQRDPMTGIGNRAFFLEKAEDMLEKEVSMVFCYCDLDHLKYINDHFGHAEGDWYIRHFVHTVENLIRKEDIFARVGGDEFCIVLQNCPLQAAKDKLQVIQNAFESEKTHEYPKSFSCGMIEVPKDHEELDIAKIIEEADAVMYLQKKKHRQSQPELQRKE